MRSPSAGADANQKYGRTPLSAAILNGHTDCAQVLLQHGARNDGCTPKAVGRLREHEARSGHAKKELALLPVGTSPHRLPSDCCCSQLVTQDDGTGCIKALAWLCRTCLEIKDSAVRVRMAGRRDRYGVLVEEGHADVNLVTPTPL